MGQWWLDCYLHVLDMSVKSTYSKTIYYLLHFILLTAPDWKRNTTSMFLLTIIGDREHTIIYAKLRLECSDLKADKYKIHISTDPKCPCGATAGAKSIF